MRQVERKPIPPILKKNRAKWRKALLAKIKTCQHTGEEVPDSLYDKYKHEEVKDTLKEMYKELCCYCESSIGVVEFGHIEHRKPKRKYPRFTFDWENLHLSCTACNINKGNKYDARHPILDATKDLIKDHLTYKVDRYGVWRVNITDQGFTTIDHADLNREKLRLDRAKVLLDAHQLIKDIKQAPRNNKVVVVRQRLKAMCEDEYGSVVSWEIEGEM